MPHPLQTIRRAIYALRAVLFRRGFDDDLQAEMRDHLERQAQQYVARGMSESDARLAAKRAFGNTAALNEDARDASGTGWIDALIVDTRFAFRYFARHKATTAIIVTVIALGTGANTLIFSQFQAYFLRPAPAVVRDDAQVRIFAQERATRTSSWELRGFSQPELAAFAAQRDIFAAVAGWTADKVIIGSGDSTGARSVNAQFVTPNFFGTLGVRLAAGMGLRDGGGNAPDMTAVMAYEIAEQLFGRAEAAVGRRIVVNEVPMYVVGVAPPRFQGALRGMSEPALWMPVSARADVEHVSPRWLTDEAALSVFARLAPGVSRERATALARHVVSAALPDSATRVGMARTADALSMQALPPGADSKELLVAITVMMTIGVVILLVAWTNVSSLMVAAAVGRRHEIAVRLSLGASRPRLLRQLVTESTMIALAGSAAGLTLAWWALSYAAKTEVHDVDLTPDVGTFAFVLAMALVTGILFGLSPALHATRGDVANALRDSGAGTSHRSRLQRGFVVAQIALSQPLLVLLGTMLALMIGEYRPLAPEMSRRVITAEFRPLKTGAPAQREEAVDSLVPRIAELADVQGAVPEPTAFSIRGVSAPNGGVHAQPDSVPTIVHIEGTAPGWFAVVDVPIILGRDVSLADTSARDIPVVIGSDMARKLWGDANPVGQTLASPGVRGLNTDSTSLTVIGVYDASRRLPGMAWNGVATRAGVTGSALRVYTARGKQWRHDHILVRTRGPAAPFVPTLRQFVRARASALPVTSMLTLAQEDDAEYRATLKNSMMAGAGGALALLLASLGLYGVVSLAVRQRTREIGIRIAVGAAPMRVARMFLVSGVRVGLVALALGLPLSIVALEIGLSQGVVIAPQVNPYAIGGVIALLLLGVSAAATWIPARRAATVDPARTLRVE